jgi:hypothetical protein
VLAPLRNPELARLCGKSLRGGLWLYGLPGCGKTFIARAVAGVMGARFLAVSLADVLDMYIGQSERNVRELFDIARRSSPCVIFLDEIDALGQKRSQQRNSATARREALVNQWLSEMDGLNSNNEGVFVLGATNHPWDVDVAFGRPGRFDRMLLVLPPDEAAREAILRYRLRERPMANVDASKLARKKDVWSGADLSYLHAIWRHAPGPWHQRALPLVKHQGVQHRTAHGDAVGRPSLGRARHDRPETNRHVSRGSHCRIHRRLSGRRVEARENEALQLASGLRPDAAHGTARTGSPVATCSCPRPARRRAGRRDPPSPNARPPTGPNRSAGP